MTYATEISIGRRRFDFRAFFQGLRADEPRLSGLAFFIAVAALPMAFAAAIDGRELLGENIWLKPLKFDFALVVYLLTLAFFARFIPAAQRQARWYRIYSSAVVLAIVAEVIWLGAAAALGTASHFNRSPVGDIIYSAMGAGAVLLTSITLPYAIMIGRNGATGLSPTVKEAIVTGLALVLPLTLITAGTMASTAGHTVGVSAHTSAFPFFGWVRDAGDLRVAHFFATHTMHAIPLFAVAYRGPGSATAWPTRIFALAYVAFVAFTFVQALGGRPFLSLIQ